MAAPGEISLFQCCHSVSISLTFARILCAKKKKLALQFLLFLIYSDALQSLDNYHLLFITDSEWPMVTDALGMKIKMQS